MTRRFALAAALAALAATFAAGFAAGIACDVCRVWRSGDAPVAAVGAGGDDSVATVRLDGVVVMADGAAPRGAPADSRAVPSVGVPSGRVPSVAVESVAPRRTPAAAAGALAPPPRRPTRGDTTPVVASDADLRELARELAIPVQGVRREQLRDTYTEARSGGRVHNAIDILAPRGTPVLSAVDGRVLQLHNSKAGGLMVYAADRSDRFILMYGHLDRYAGGLARGMPLRRGQVIGYVGTTGNAPPGTPHLHFVVSRGRPSVSWWQGTPVNPYPLLAGRAPERPR